MFNSLHSVHIVALLEEESLPLVMQMESKSFRAAVMTFSFKHNRDVDLSPSLSTPDNNNKNKYKCTFWKSIHAMMISCRTKLKHLNKYIKLDFKKKTNTNCI